MFSGVLQVHGAVTSSGVPVLRRGDSSLAVPVGQAALRGLSLHRIPGGLGWKEP